MVKYKFFDELEVTITAEILRKIYKFVQAFCSNYSFMESVIRLQLTNLIEKENNKEVVVNNEVQNNKSIVIKETPRNEIDEIFELCLNTSIKMFLVNQLFNYHIINKNTIKFEDNTLYCGDLFINSYGIDYTYLNSLILNNQNELNIDNINHVLLKLLQMCLDERFNYSKIFLFLISNLILLYCIRLFLEYYREYTLNKLYEILNNIQIQESLINNAIAKNKILVGFKDRIKFKFIKSSDNDNNQETIDKIKKLGEKFDHLKSIDADTFIKEILSGLREQKEQIIKLPISNFKTLNIKNLINNSPRKDISQNLFNLKNIHTNQIKEYEFLEYKINKSNKITTESYDLILKYIKDPTIMLTLEPNKINIPNSVLKLFDLLSKEVLNTNIIQKDNINTLEYYLILRNKIPNIEKFNNIIIFYIIYQCIIPFSIDMHKNYIFEDCFLL